MPRRHVPLYPAGPRLMAQKSHPRWWLSIALSGTSGPTGAVPTVVDVRSAVLAGSGTSCDCSRACPGSRLAASRRTTSLPVTSERGTKVPYVHGCLGRRRWTSVTAVAKVKGEGADMAGAAVASTRDRSATRSPALMLALATIGFAVNFWAWALISPLGPMFRDLGTLGDLTESDVALLVAVPVLVGSLGQDPGGRAHRPLRRPGHVPAGLRGDDPPDPVHRLRRPGLLHPAARRRLLPRHRAGRRSRSASRSSTRGSRPSGAAWRSASSAPAWAAPRSAP